VRSAQVTYAFELELELGNEGFNFEDGRKRVIIGDDDTRVVDVDLHASDPVLIKKCVGQHVGIRLLAEFCDFKPYYFEMFYTSQRTTLFTTYSSFIKRAPTLLV